MKKNRKIFVIAFISLLGVMLPISANAAYADMSYEIKHLSDTDTYDINKTATGAQKVKVTNAYTPLTDPCTNCQISFKPYRQGYGPCEGLIATMGQTKQFSITTSNYTGKYHLTLRRVDVTLLSTTVSFRWTYQ